MGGSVGVVKPQVLPGDAIFVNVWELYCLLSCDVYAWLSESME